MSSSSVRAAKVAGVLLLSSLLGCGALGLDRPVTVEAEPAGENCPDGGVRITDPDGERQYLCHGAPGANGDAGAPGAEVQIEPEPPGPNCPDGGLRVTAPEGTPFYVCQTRVAAPVGPVGFCSGDASLEEGSLQAYVEIDGADGFKGGSRSPAVPGQPAIEGVIKATSICHGLARSDATDPRLVHRPYTVIARRDRSGPQLLTAMDLGANLTVTVHYFAPSVENQELAVTSRVELANARLVLVEFFTAPDPEHLGSAAEFIRFSLLYTRFVSTDLPRGLVTELDPPTAFLPLEPAIPCVAAGPVGDGVFAEAIIGGSRVGGDDLDPSLREPSIRVHAACIRFERAYVGPLLSSTPIRPGPLHLVKASPDTATPAILKGLAQHQVTSFHLRHYGRLEDGSGSPNPIVTDANDVFSNGVITGYEQFLQDGLALERLTIRYHQFRQDWVRGSDAYEYLWESPPEP